MKPAIVIGAVTRDRPAMFARLLQSFAAMNYPDDATIHFVFAENAPVPSVGAPVAELRGHTGCACELLAEPRLGIPFARNRVLDRALALGADYLVFVDDDEWVEPDWLIALWKGFRGGGYQLATGPVCPVYQGDGPLGMLQKRLLDGVIGWERRTQRKNLCNMARNQPFRIGAATNKWICDLAFLRRTGLRFDETIGLGGGEDTAFWRQLVALGGRNSWIDNAWVCEEVPRSRLSVGYQFRRGRDQAIAEWHRRKLGGGLWMWLRSLPLMTRCAVAGVVRICVGIVVPGPYLVFGLRDLGKAAGRAQAIRGGVSHHYRRVHGT